MEPKSILFVEQTERGELGSRLRDLITRISPTLGFSVKIVERTGTSLRNKLPSPTYGRELAVGDRTVPPAIRKLRSLYHAPGDL